MQKSTAEKALSLNLIRPLYGSLAEIGAGQEVARWFFKVGGAAGTIAKAMSAYDMTFSDDIYGREDSGRYVVESRVRRMIDHEYSLLETRLSEQDNHEKYFFAFANTVAAKSFKYSGDCHGWVGLKFQHSPDEDPSQVILHVRMLDSTNLHQQEALGVLGVNLIYACYHHHKNIDAFLKSLHDGDLNSSIEVNLVRFEGPIFKDVDPVKANLMLLEQGLTPLVHIAQDGRPEHLGEALYNKQVIIHRGKFNPPLRTDIDILSSARNHYCGAKSEGLCDPYLMSEIYMDKTPIEDIYQRVSWLIQCGQHAMVTQLDRTYKITEYVAQFTNNHIHIVFRAGKILEILEDQKMASLDRLSRIFNERTRMYIYPVAADQVQDQFKKDTSLTLFNLSNYQPSEMNCHLYNHLTQSGYIQELKEVDEELAPWDCDTCLELKAKDPKAWEKLLACKISLG